MHKWHDFVVDACPFSLKGQAHARGHGHGRGRGIPFFKLSAVLAVARSVMLNQLVERFAEGYLLACIRWPELARLAASIGINAQHFINKLLFTIDLLHSLLVASFTLIFTRLQLNKHLIKCNSLI